jgi:transcription elongation factor Elf1
MSKKVEASVRCPKCGHKQNVVLFRSIWAEYPENRSLVLNDLINQFRCGNCNHRERLEFPFLCTNVPKGVAIWYEPYHDTQIDADAERYREHMGPNSFYAKAPRISDWETFKAKYLELEAAGPESDQKPQFSSESRKMFRGFIDSLKGKKPRGQ